VAAWGIGQQRVERGKDGGLAILGRVAVRNNKEQECCNEACEVDLWEVACQWEGMWPLSTALGWWEWVGICVWDMSTLVRMAAWSIRDSELFNSGEQNNTCTLRGDLGGAEGAKEAAQCHYIIMATG
jgi:hypothetical protein